MGPDTSPCPISKGTCGTSGHSHQVIRVLVPTAPGTSSAVVGGGPGAGAAPAACWVTAIHPSGNLGTSDTCLHPCPAAWTRSHFHSILPWAAVLPMGWVVPSRQDQHSQCIQRPPAPCAAECPSPGPAAGTRGLMAPSHAQGEAGAAGDRDNSRTGLPEDSRSPSGGS